RPFGLMAKLKVPIEFDAIAGQAVDIVFVLLVPANAENGQLGALALVARTLRSSEIRDRLRRAKDASGLHSVIV
ncbi:MAG TPA: PTS sugar transporter subunit IIA, partial [Bradyrhizobium sp.]